MKMIFFFLCSILTGSLGAQNDLNKVAQPIVEEGKRLYRLEMASWYGTDLFVERYKEMENVGGYFSYIDGDLSKCIFFSRSDNPKVISTISFDSTYDIASADVSMEERTFTSYENDLFEIRRLTIGEINSDTMFKSYENARLNLIPLIDGQVKKVYILTGPQESGVVILGNDYLLSFDGNNKILKKKALHKNIIPIYYGDENGENDQVEGGVHTHLPETGDFITATDICTLMLYSKYAGWKSHVVVSEKYMNIWNCETNSLIVVPRK